MTTLKAFFIASIIALAVSTSVADDKPPRSGSHPPATFYTDPRQVSVCWQMECDRTIIHPLFALAGVASDSAPSVTKRPANRPARRDGGRSRVEQSARRANRHNRTSPHYRPTDAVMARHTSRAISADETVCVEVGVLPERRRRYDTELGWTKSGLGVAAWRLCASRVLSTPLRSTLAVRRFRRGGVLEGWITINAPGR